jgi:hypothetical protein
MTNYYNKYLKYKNKYFELKEIIGGAANQENTDFNIVLQPSGTTIQSNTIGFLKVTNLETNTLVGSTIKKYKINESNQVELNQNEVFENNHYVLSQIVNDDLPSLKIEYKETYDINDFNFKYDVIINELYKTFIIHVRKNGEPFRIISIKGNRLTDFVSPNLVGFIIDRFLPITILHNGRIINGNVKKINEARNHEINIILPSYNYSGVIYQADPNIVNNVRLLDIITETKFNFQNEYDIFRDTLNRDNPLVCQNNILKKQLVTSLYNNFILDNTELVINYKDTFRDLIFKRIFSDFLNRIVLQKLIDTNACNLPIIKSEILNNTIKKIPTKFTENIEIRNGANQYIQINNINYAITAQDGTVTQKTTSVVFDTGNGSWCLIYRPIAEALNLPIHRSFRINATGGSTGALTSNEYVNITMRFVDDTVDFNVGKEFSFKAYIVDSGITEIVLGQNATSLFKFFEDQYCITHNSFKNNYNDDLIEAQRLYTDALQSSTELYNLLNDYNNNINELNYDLGSFSEVLMSFVQNCNLNNIRMINKFDGIDEINITSIFTNVNNSIIILSGHNNINVITDRFRVNMLSGRNITRSIYNISIINDAISVLSRSYLPILNTLM